MITNKFLIAQEKKKLNLKSTFKKQASKCAQLSRTRCYINGEKKTI